MSEPTHDHLTTTEYPLHDIEVAQSDPRLSAAYAILFAWLLQSPPPELVANAGAQAVKDAE